MPNSKLLLGIDEAGYGPNLGPLTIAASVWMCDDYCGELDFSRRLAELFRPTPWKTECQHVPLGDSKQLYKPSRGIISLEAGLLATISQFMSFPVCVADLLSGLAANSPTAAAMQLSSPWYARLAHESAPIDVHLTELQRLAGKVENFLKSAGIKLLSCDLLVVSAAEFNQQLEKLSSKGQVLSRFTLALVADILQRIDQAEVEVFCDRQGGRKDYLPVLLDAMPQDWFIQTARSDRRSSYRRNNGSQCDIHFSVGGDSFPPTALASMLAKYARERVMKCFNEFWHEQVDDIKPTAGYPVDAKRFRREIESKAAALKLPLKSWWRMR